MFSGRRLTCYLRERRCIATMTTKPPTASTEETEASSSLAATSSPVIPPSWDLLSCNSYLVSLLPIEETLKYFPGIFSQKEFHDLLRCVAAAWLLWTQHGAGPSLGIGDGGSIRQKIRVILGNRRKVVLFTLAFMDWVPSIYHFFTKQLEAGTLQISHQHLNSTMHHHSPSDSTSHRQSQLAMQRRQKLWKILKSIWPMVRLALWMRLAWTDEDEGSSSSAALLSSSSPVANQLFVLYAHRRWLQEETMELWSTVCRPIVQSAQETRQWLVELWRQLVQS